MMYIRKLIKEWFYFLLHPGDVFPDESARAKTGSFIFYLIFICIISTVFSFAVQYLFLQLFKWHIISLPVILKPDYHQVSIVGMVVIAPIVEELLFRLNLRYRSVFISFILTLILYSIFVRIVLGLLPFYYLWESIGNIAIIMVISVFVNLFIRRFNKSLEWFWIKYFRLIFYSSAIIFGFMHLGNYWIPNYTIVLLSPFFLLPFMFAGLNLGYIRLRYGIIFSIVLHAFNNLMPYIFHYNFR